MVASRKQKSGHKKIKVVQKKINPFELKFNRSKHTILGKKEGTAVIGRPGFSKKRAYQQRENTLGVEYDRIGKVNKIIDKRIGEKDGGKTADEKASMRFTAERIKNFKKSSKFNLADDIDDYEDVLTHGGKVLTAIQKYDRTIASDDEEDTGNISADVVKVAHFGGGNLEKNRYHQEKQSRKEVIADIIARTKQARQEKQDAKDEQEVAIENIDQKYNKLLDKIQNVFRPIGATKAEKIEKDDYDKLAFMLKVDADARSTPAERTKTTEEMAMREKEKLEEMENLRVARMNTQKNKRGHISADADFDRNSFNDSGKKRVKQTDNFVVRFDSQGKLIDGEKVEKSSIKKIAIDSDDEVTDEEDDSFEEDLENMLSDEERDAKEKISSGKDGENNEQEGSDDGEDNEDEQGNNEDDEDNEQDESSEDDDDDDDVEKSTESDDRISESKDRIVRKVELRACKDDLDVPFIFEMPRNYSKLIELLALYPTCKIGIIIDRIVKCHHPSLQKGNKQKLMKLFLFLLRLFDDTAKETPTKDSVMIIEILIKSLYDVMKFDIEYSVRCMRAFIRQNWKLRPGKSRRSEPSLTIVALLRLVASLYPVSDVWHPVCTPAMALAAVTLVDYYISSLSILARQILVVTVIADFVEESKRYIPEAISFLRSALLLAVENGDDERAPSVVFPLSLPHRRMLYIEDVIARETVVEPLKLEQVFDIQHTGSLDHTPLNKCRVLRALIAIIQKFRLIYATHEHTFTAIFTPFVELLKRIPVDRLPSVLAEEVDVLIQSIEAECMRKTRLIQLSQVKTEKSMIKMLEPRFEENFDPERPRIGRDLSRKGASAEKKKLQHLYKKEMRGAIKELRKDNSFLNRKQRKDIQAKDRDRRMKMKKLMHGLQEQQGEWNQEKWENGKKKN